MAGCAAAVLPHQRALEASDSEIWLLTLTRALSGLDQNHSHLADEKAEAERELYTFLDTCLAAGDRSRTRSHASCLCILCSFCPSPRGWGVKAVGWWGEA